MKLVRYGAPGTEKPGVIDAEGQVRDLSAVVGDVGPALLADLSPLYGVEVAALPVVDGAPRLGPCVGGTGKFVCIGLNYSDHAAETGAVPPAEPIVFLKATSAMAGARDPIVLPRGSRKTDWEVELGVVVGAPAKYVGEEDAMRHVAGYCVVNDVSEREFQVERCGQWTKGKSCDSFGPVGPWLVTADEVDDPQNLRLWAEVNGARRQDGCTATMIFGVRFLVAYLSRFMSLYPGDVIATGTPPGVGLGMTPPVFLQAGDVVRLGVEGLGEQRHEVVA